jgi:exonuclease VII small subunit
MHEHHQFLMYEVPKPDFEEMHANITLAYRHLEDAAMRLGKAIQAFDGGVSVYDK